MGNKTFGFKGIKGVSLEDSLFIYVEWDERANPKNNDRLDNLITDLDVEYFSNTKSTIRRNLPFLTFKQAELLFRGIHDTFEYFKLEGIALLTQLNAKGKLIGKTSLEDSPQVIPFEIGVNYTNLVIPIIESTFRDERFQHYSYDDLAKYFCSVEHNLMDCYGNSLGLSRSEYPLFPVKGTILGELPRLTDTKTDRGHTDGATKGNISPKEEYLRDYNPPIKPHKPTLVMSLVALIISIFLLISSIGNHSQVKNLSDKVNYLHDKQTNIHDIQVNERSLDVFGRFFLSNYYSGKKENIIPYLSDGDARYTQPATGSISSLLLEKVTLNENVYTLTYVVTLKNTEGSITNNRISFSVQKSSQAHSQDWKWEVVREPISKTFLQQSSNNNR
ncbi:TPA: hypothetical protein ACQ0F8_001614 [Streptococcus agalactiae]|nr:hypothetical protein [Streptococcus agalactiae]HEO4177423.1 hypothetical protein [Streptococcus agalactiae]